MRHLFQTRVVQEPLRLAEIADKDILLAQRGQRLLCNLELTHVVPHAFQPLLRVTGARKQQ